MYAIVRLKEVTDRVGFQKPPCISPVVVCTGGMKGVREHVARLKDNPDESLSWREIKSRLLPTETIVKLVKDGSPEPTENVTVWLTAALVPDKEPLQGFVYLDQGAIFTHDAGVEATICCRNQAPYRLVVVTEDPEPAEESLAVASV